MEKLTVIFAFVGVSIISAINSQLTIPYAILAGAYIMSFLRR